MIFGIRILPKKLLSGVLFRPTKVDFLTHESLFSGHESPFFGHESLFSDHESLFSDHESLFSDHESPFSGHESPFSGHESGFFCPQKSRGFGLFDAFFKELLFFSMTAFCLLA